MMFMISYINMTNDPQAQARFDGAVQMIKPWANALAKNGVWIVKSNKSASQLRDELKAVLNKEDRLFVARISRHWAGAGMNKSFPEWMMNQDFGTFTESEQGPRKS